MNFNEDRLELSGPYGRGISFVVIIVRWHSVIVYKLVLSSLELNKGRSSFYWYYQLIRKQCLI
jgi:hypothetical protein